MVADLSAWENILAKDLAHGHWYKHNNTIFCAVQKAGINSIRTATKDQKIGVRKVFQEYRQRSSYFAALVRSPNERFRSFYVNKILLTAFRENKSLHLDARPKFNKKILGDTSTTPYPPETYARNLRHTSFSDGHTTPFWHTCALHKIAYDAVGDLNYPKRFENRIRRWDDKFRLPYIHSNQGKWMYRLSCTSLCALAVVYKDDFFWLQYHTGVDYLSENTRCACGSISSATS